MTTVNSAREVPRYSLAERDRRWRMAREVMGEVGVDALVVFGDREGVGPAPFAPDVFFTNDRPGSIVIFCGDEEPFELVFSPMAISDHLESIDRGEAVWVPPEHVGVGRNPMGVAQVLTEHGLGDAVIGVVGLEPYAPFYFNGAIPHALVAGIESALPGATLRPAWRPLARRMAVLSDEQLAVVRRCAEIGERMAGAMVDAARPGATQADLVAAAMHEAYAGGGSSPYIVLNSGPRFWNWGPPAWLYRPEAPRVIESGDVILAELFSTFAMAETQHQVAIAVGDVDPMYDKLAEACRASYQEGIATVRPGATFGDVVAAMRAPIDAIGGWNLTPLVHGLNPILFVDGCGEGLVSVPGADRYRHLGAIPTIGADVPLQEGMTFAFEPDCFVGDIQMNLGTTVIVGPDGAEELSTFTNQLVHV
jgi:Xaa-Pro aminopeptidase